MSYTKHTWVNNETITAAKMNNIEEGILESQGGTVPIMSVVFPDGVGSWTKAFNFAICKYVNGTYVAQSVVTGDGTDTLDTTIVYTAYNEGGGFYMASPFPVPESTDLYLVFLDPFNFIVSYTGNVSPSSVNVDYGSTAVGRVVYGDFTVSLIVD